MTRHDEKAKTIARFLSDRGWLKNVDESCVRFLAAGEYNENHLITCGNSRHVFRINHGSQLGLERQIEYEFDVLRAVEASGVTPRPCHVEGDAPGLGGVLLMEFLPGTALDYARDSAGAARTFAKIHALPTSDRLLRQSSPVADIAAESRGLLDRFPDHPLPDVRRLLEGYHEQIVRLGERTDGEFSQEQQVTANTEVNSGNFLVHEGRVRLVDWEKAVTTCRYQDLGHFLVPTTTLWKSSYRFDREARMDFLRGYKEASGIDLPIDELSRRTHILEQTILLRALSWCYMAYYEYTRQDRAIRNNDTFATIRRYLDEAACFLKPGI